MVAPALISHGWAASAPAKPKTGAKRAASTTAQPKRVLRTRAEVDALINKVGRTAPDWWNSVPLEYPKTLDLSWSKADKEWNNQKNVGQYLWDIINPNPGRWKQGAKLLHHLLVVNKDDPQKVLQIMDALARLYYGLLEDYPRAAFWWRKVNAGRKMPYGSNAIQLAECYWKLGNKAMAVEILNWIGPDYTRNGNVIKLWSDMGDVQKALALAEARAREGMTDSAYLAAGDVCRLAGRYPQALAYYQKVLSEEPSNALKGDIPRNRDRARASIEAIRVFDTLDLARVADGTYKSNSLGYAGQLYVSVTVKSGRIESVEVTQHQEKQFYSSLTDTPSQIIAKQSVKGIDVTSGATITSEAIINATAKALAGGMK
ncbi:MAG: FMN-binding protein [Pirellulales bacterium]